MKTLRIGLVAPPWFAVPPRGYGGIEWVVSSLADGLAERGHDVTLFASGGSQTSARLVSTYAEPPSAALGDPFVEAPALFDAYANPGQFDLVHDHTILGLIAAATLSIPAVHTVHGLVTPKLARLYEHVAGRIHIVAISRDQASSLPAACEPTVIHNGVSLDRFPLGEGERGNWLLFVGRMSPDKGILEAIEIARRADMPLRVIAKVNEPEERAYFQDHVAPALDTIRHELLLAATHDEKVAAYQSARATLFPIRWREPFGLVMAESMACGTPVIAFRDGAAPEVIADGVTGFVRDTVEEAVEALRHVDEIDPNRCRARVAERFSAEANVARHEALYRRLLGTPGEKAAPAAPLAIAAPRVAPIIAAAPAG
ncbi:MAG: glycosyltransferase family 4 protein [Dehalococcoidia bacterium]|nr:glycosyltransferase family 4 protein [Dehalococcoidia bacterium]